MANQRKKTEHEKNPLIVLYRMLCDSVFDDECGVNGTAYNALMILGKALSEDVMNEINARVYEEDGRYRYRDDY